jgi:N-acetylmuramoyl-L-alanine amidase
MVLAMVLMAGQGYAQKSGSVKKIVIDAGHGGHDPGAVGRKAKEKNVNLAIALKLGNMIQRNMKDVKVIYTRDRDNFVELHRRAEIANQNKADLFISIHCNANAVKTLKGSETYVMGLHRSKANLDIAKLENASILLESDYKSMYDGFDPNTDESYITFSLFQNSNLDQSTELAAEIQDMLEERVGMNNRGVRQAGFLVLYKTTMPSVLVEAGYLSNPTEESFLISDKGQEYIATAIYKAFRTYKEKIENPGAGREPVVRDYVPKKETIQSSRPPADTSPPVRTEVKPKKETPPVVQSRGLSYRVQVASTLSDIGTSDPKFAKLGKVRMYKHGGMFKYTVGDEPDLAGAQRLLAEVKKKGIRDAFVVIFRNDERVSAEEAKRLMGF